MPEPTTDSSPEQRPGLADRILASLKDPAQYAALEAEGRRGLKDLQDAVLVAFPDSAKSRDEAGTIANPTQQIVTSQIRGTDPGMSLDQMRGHAQERAQDQPGQEQDHKRDGREM